MIYKFDNEKITFNDFFIKLNLIQTDKLKFSISDRVLKKINTEFEIIKNNLNSTAPIYGINTGLGGNLHYKLQNFFNFRPRLIFCTTNSHTDKSCQISTSEISPRYIFQRKLPILYNYPLL